MTKTLWCLVGLMGVLLIGSPHTANAQEPWRTMHGSQNGQEPANPPTVEAARQQCIDQLVPVATCNRMAAMLDQGRCVVEPIPDRVVYETLGGRNGATRNMMKMLGGNTDAFVCRVQDYELHWYSSRIPSLGERACNNFGVVAKRPQPKLEVTTSRPMSSPKVFVQETNGIHIHTDQCCHDCGPGITYLPGTRATLFNN